MQSMTNTLTLLTLSACLGACVPGAPEILPPASSVTRREALETSRAYTSMAWRGSPRNVRHGTDEDGIRIDTPDASAAGGHARRVVAAGARSTGMPYQMGRVRHPPQFAERLKADAANGAPPPRPGTWAPRKSRPRGMPPSAALPPGWTAPASSPAAGACPGHFPHGSSPLLSISLPSWDELKTGTS